MSKQITSFDFYYGKEAEQFNFYRIPKLLFTDERFRRLSSDAKILYGLLLNRMSLSIKNGWVDDENRVYIYFTVKEAMEELNIAKEKCTKIFAELDSEKGCGLIVKKRQELGKPAMLYVMNFSSYASQEQQDNKSQEIRKSNTWRFENRNSEISEIESQEVRNSKSNNNDINNYTDFSYNNPIISDDAVVMDEITECEKYRELIAQNIEYDIVVKNYSQDLADGILETMLDVVCNRKDYLIVSGSEIPQTVVKNRFLKLNYGHIEYVLDCLYKNTTKIYNIKSYMLTALYNSFTTIDCYYRAEANQDVYAKI